MLAKQYTSKKKKCRVTFSLPLDAAANATNIKVLGEFNNWQRDAAVAMNRSSDQFQLEMELEAGRTYQFRYLIDNHRWLNDQEADDYFVTPFGIKNSVVAV